MSQCILIICICLYIVKPFRDGLFDITQISRLEDAGIPLLNELSATIISHQLSSMALSDQLKFGLHKHVGLATFLTELVKLKKDGLYLPTWKKFVLFLRSLKLDDLALQISNYVGLNFVSEVASISTDTEGRNERNNYYQEYIIYQKEEKRV